MTADVEDVLGSVAGFGLPGAIGAWPTSPLPADHWDRLVLSVRSQRLTGLLAASIADGALPVTDEQAENASEAHFHALCDSLFLESGTLRVLDLLEDAGVEARVLKGSAVAHLDYPDPALRQFGDVDLLVRGEDFDRAVHQLTSAGSERRYPQPRPGFDRRFSKGTSFLTPDGFELDLHRTFVMGPYGLRMRLEDLWETQSTFQLAGRSVRALDAELRFVHACFHSALGEITPRLVPQRDVAQMLLGGRLDLDRVRAVTRRWGAEPVIARAISQTWTTLRIADVTALSAWAARYTPDARAIQDLAVYSDPDGSYAAKSIAAMVALPSMRDRAAFALALVFPDRSYVDGRHAGPSQRWRRGLRAARRMTVRR